VFGENVVTCWYFWGELCRFPTSAVEYIRILSDFPAEGTGTFVEVTSPPARVAPDGAPLAYGRFKESEFGVVLLFISSRKVFQALRFGLC
jgi:hypothetical protein